MNNKDVRERMYTNHLKQWEVAEAVGITAFTLCVWLRTELSEERRRRVDEAIDKLIAEKCA